jgi:transcriptional regulator with GAF, ATPase, and Fis domain
VAMVERRMIQRALEQNDWVKTRSAKSLGLSERVLTYKMEKYDIIKK